METEIEELKPIIENLKRSNCEKQDFDKNFLEDLGINYYEIK